MPAIRVFLPRAYISVSCCRKLSPCGPMKSQLRCRVFTRTHSACPYPLIPFTVRVRTLLVIITTNSSLCLFRTFRESGVAGGRVVRLLRISCPHLRFFILHVVGSLPSIPVRAFVLIAWFSGLSPSQSRHSRARCQSVCVHTREPSFSSPRALPISQWLRRCAFSAAGTNSSSSGLQIQLVATTPRRQ